MAKRKNKNKNQFTESLDYTFTLPETNYLPVDRKFWDSIKRRIAISEKLFDFKDVVLVYIGGVVGGWITFFSVSEDKTFEYKKWMIVLSVVGFLVLCLYLWIKICKKEFNSTIVEDMENLEN